MLEFKLLYKYNMRKYMNANKKICTYVISICFKYIRMYEMYKPPCINAYSLNIYNFIVYSYVLTFDMHTSHYLFTKTVYITSLRRLKI